MIGERDGTTNDGPTPRTSGWGRRFRRLRFFALCGATPGLLVGPNVTWVPRVTAWGEDVTWVVGTAEFALLGGAFGVAVGLVVMAADRVGATQQGRRGP